MRRDTRNDDRHAHGADRGGLGSSAEREIAPLRWDVMPASLPALQAMPWPSACELESPLAATKLAAEEGGWLAAVVVRGGRPCASFQR